MSDDDSKGPVGQAVEALVYAPIGLFFEGPRLLPELIEQGKTHARNARVFGKFAVQQGQVELKRRLSSFEEQASEVLRAFGATGDGESARPPGAPGSGPPASGSSASPGPSAAASSSTGAPLSTNGAAEAASPAVGELAITDYDSLSASQVVTRLAGLTGGELEAVRAYEVAHRGRKTILNKIAQLQA
jgi:hypothetical protein